MYPVYYVVEDDTLPHLFGSYDGGTGASITLTGLAVTDIEIYKDGSTTQRSSDSGYSLLDTDGIDFDGITGIHGFSIDLSDNTDAGFYSVGPWYHVVVSAVTIDGQTVSFIACAFRIVSATRGLAGTALPAAAADAAGGLPISDAGALDLDTLNSNIAAILVDTGTTLDAALAVVDANVDAILVDTAEIGAAGAGLTAVPLNTAWFSTALTESYASAGNTASIAQLLYMILSLLSEFAVSGTTVTAKKLDGSTTAGTFTLDDSANPTSMTRTT